MNLQGIEFKEGDVFNYENEKLVFVRWKRGAKTMVVEKLNGEEWSYRGGLYDTYEVLERGTQLPSKKGNKEYEDEFYALRSGELFVMVNNNGRGELYKFIEYTRSGKITASFALDSSKKMTIGKGLKVVKLSSI